MHIISILHLKLTKIMSNPKFIQDWYLKLWSWDETFRQRIGKVGDTLQYLLPIAFLAYCVATYGWSGLTIDYALYFGCVMATSTLFKIAFNNIRPRDWDDVSDTPQISPEMNLQWSPREGQSFTSSHTAAAFGGALPWFVVNPWIGVIATILATVVGFSRIVVKAHWLRDVLGAIAIAILWGAIFINFVL